jgi:uncharacterized membrane protein
MPPKRAAHKLIMTAAAPDDGGVGLVQDVVHKLRMALHAIIRLIGVMRAGIDAKVDSIPVATIAVWAVAPIIRAIMCSVVGRRLISRQKHINHRGTMMCV